MSNENKLTISQNLDDFLKISKNYTSKKQISEMLLDQCINFIFSKVWLSNTFFFSGSIFWSISFVVIISGMFVTPFLGFIFLSTPFLATTEGVACLSLGALSLALASSGLLDSVVVLPRWSVIIGPPSATLEYSFKNILLLYKKNLI